MSHPTTHQSLLLGKHETQLLEQQQHHELQQQTLQSSLQAALADQQQWQQQAESISQRLSTVEASAQESERTLRQREADVQKREAELDAVTRAVREQEVLLCSFFCVRPCFSVCVFVPVFFILRMLMPVLVCGVHVCTYVCPVYFQCTAWCPDRSWLLRNHTQTHTLIYPHIHALICARAHSHTSSHHGTLFRSQPSGAEQQQWGQQKLWQGRRRQQRQLWLLKLLELNTARRRRRGGCKSWSARWGVCRLLAPIHSSTYAENEAYKHTFTHTSINGLTSARMQAQ